eukprot:scaffold6241_cov129-Cylindrotheca_fusiformis.AAC.8
MERDASWPYAVIGCTVGVVFMCLVVLTRDAGEKVTPANVLLHAEHMMLPDDPLPTKLQQEAGNLRKTKSDEETFMELKDKFNHVEDTLDKLHGIMHDGVKQKRDFLEKMKLDGTHNKEVIKELEDKLEDAQGKMKDLEELFTLVIAPHGKSFLMIVRSEESGTGRAIRREMLSTEILTHKVNQPFFCPIVGARRR